MSPPSVLMMCVECGRQVSTLAAFCPGCRASPKGVPCTVCGDAMSKTQVVSIKIPHGMDYSHEDGHFFRYATVLVHQRCWDQLVQELFPPALLQGSCAACGATRSPPVATDIGFPSEWTCAACGHPCALERRAVGWCRRCNLPIVPGLHGYWSFEEQSRRIDPISHQPCGNRITRRSAGTWILREAGDTRPPALSFWERLFPNNDPVLTSMPCAKCYRSRCGRRRG